MTLNDEKHSRGAFLGKLVGGAAAVGIAPGIAKGASGSQGGSFDSEIAQLQSDDQAAQSAIAALQTQQAADNAAIATLQSQIASLQGTGSTQPSGGDQTTLSGLWWWPLKDAVVASNSSAFVANLAGAAGFTMLAADVSVVTALATDPVYEITPAEGGPTFNVRIPAGAVEGPSYDHHLSVTDPISGTETDMFHYAHGSTPTCDMMAQFPIGAVNENNGENGAANKYGWGATAALLPLRRGLVRPSDIASGVTHPLVFSANNSVIGTPPVYPSVPGRTDLGAAQAGANGPGFGSRFGFLPMLPKPSGFSPLSSYLWDCLVDYGMYLRDGDTENYITLYGEFHPASDWAAVGVAMKIQENNVTCAIEDEDLPWSSLVMFTPPSA